MKYNGIISFTHILSCQVMWQTELIRINLIQLCVQFYAHGHRFLGSCRIFLLLVACSNCNAIWHLKEAVCTSYIGIVKSQMVHTASPLFLTAHKINSLLTPLDQQWDYIFHASAALLLNIRLGRLLNARLYCFYPKLQEQRNTHNKQRLLAGLVLRL